MKLKTYDSTNVAKKATRQKPFISVDGKHGNIRFNKALCKSLGLKHGSCVSFHQDEENPKDWYISKNPEGFPLRYTSRQAGGALITNSAWTVDKIMKSISESTQVTVRMLVSTDSVEEIYYPIITRSVKD